MEDSKKLQMVELEIMIEFDRVCRKHDIKYSIYGGTLLGAIRHGGFIPWDDDIDLTMTREEYNKFYEVADELDPERFFLQEYRTDPYYRIGHPKIRRKNTMYARSGQGHMKYMKGIPVDIMVVDNIPDGEFKRKLNSKMRFCLRKLLYSQAWWPNIKNPIFKCFIFLLSKIPRNWLFAYRNAMAKHYNKKKTENVYCLSVPRYNERTEYGVPASYYEEYTELEFEGMKFMAFADYDSYLKLAYGDYMQLPPEDKRHGNAPADYFECPELNIEDLRKSYYEGIK